VTAKLANIIVEVCPEILKSVTQLIPEFKALFRFNDLAKNKKNAARLIELMAPLHLLAELTMARCMQASESALLHEINKLRNVRSLSKTEEELKKMESYRDRLTTKKLKDLDKALKNIDFDIKIEVSKVGANVTGN